MQPISYWANFILIWLPEAFTAAVFLAVAGRYVLKKKYILRFYLFRLKLRTLVLAVVGFNVIFSLTLSVIQYYIWRQDQLARFLLPPNQPVGYFLNYVFTRVWLNLIIATTVSVIFYGILRLLEKYRSSLFDKEDTLLLFLMALVAGWPNVIIFIPLAFGYAVIFSLIEKVNRKSNRINISLPCILSALTVLVLGNWLVEIFNLTVLKI